MTKVIEDLKNKNEDLFKNLVSCGKSSNENDQGPSRNVPLGDDLGQTTKSDVQVQEEIVVIEQGNNTQNQEQPTNIPLDDVAQQQQQEQEQQEDDEDEDDEDEDEDEDEEENDDDFESLPSGARAKVSKPPSKRPAPAPKTG